MKRLRKGDQVVVLSGRDKGRKGEIKQVLADGSVLVEGVNVAKKHQRANPQRNEQGGILEKEMPLAGAKVAVWNAAKGKGDRVGFKTLADGKKVRVFKSSGEQLDV
jgi:large subunit ribosomal protein L24